MVASGTSIAREFRSLDSTLGYLMTPEVTLRLGHGASPTSWLTAVAGPSSGSDVPGPVRVTANRAILSASGSAGGRVDDLVHVRAVWLQPVVPKPVEDLDRARASEGAGRVDVGGPTAPAGLLAGW